MFFWWALKAQGFLLAFLDSLAFPGVLRPDLGSLGMPGLEGQENPRMARGTPRRTPPLGPRGTLVPTHRRDQRLS